MVVSKHKLLIGGMLIVGAGVLLFTRLGHYPFWDDEVNTALFARSIWRNGDTYAVVDHNIVAYGGGRELTNLHNRYMPPLTYYLAAPFVGLSGGSTFAARFPFALSGLLTVGLVIFWLWRDKADTRMWWLMAIAILGNVSFMLYSRQCRYWSLAILASTAVAYFYLHWAGRWRILLAMSVAALVLMAANYMSYLALHVCMCVDYVLWHRKKRPLKWKDWLVYLIPQIVVGALLVSAYMPHKDVGVYFPSALWFRTKATMFLWSFRDINRCEFGVLLLILAAPVLSFLFKNRWLLRGFIAVVAYSLVVGIAAPEVILPNGTAPMRLYAPAILLYITLSVLSLRALTEKIPKITIPLAMLVFLSTVTHGKFLWGKGVRSTLVDYAGELIHPLPSAYTAAADWINANLKERQSIWVQPHYAPYPLIWLAPKALYAWQIRPQMQGRRFIPELQGQFAALPRIHFSFCELPDYILVFGPKVEGIRAMLGSWATKGIRYRQRAIVNIYWDLGVQASRPELYSHRFKNVTEFDKNLEAVYVFERLLPRRAAGSMRRRPGSQP